MVIDFSIISPCTSCTHSVKYTSSSYEARSAVFQFVMDDMDEIFLRVLDST